MDAQMSLWQATESAFTQYGGCYLHDEACIQLTDEWQRLGSLKSERLSPGVFEDLVFFGYADFLVEAIGQYDEDGQFKTRGCRQWYRRGTGTREEVRVDG